MVGVRAPCCLRPCNRDGDHVGACRCAEHMPDGPQSSIQKTVELVTSTTAQAVVKSGPDTIGAQAPTIRNLTRGSRASIQEASAIPQGRQEALKALRANIAVGTTQKSRDALWSTWCFTAKIWGINPLPITKETVEMIIAGLRQGGYRSVSAFVARAKQIHLMEIGSPICERTEFWIKEFIRSAERGKGPSALKNAFPFEALTLHEDAGNLRTQQR